MTGYIRVTLIVSEEEGGFVSICPELGVASQGESIGEAFEWLEDAILTHLNTIEQLGERERVFRERRIKIWREAPVTEVSLKLRPNQFGSPFVAPVQPTERKDEGSLVATGR